MTPTGTRLATLPYFFIERYTASYIRQWEAFVAAVQGGESPPTSGQDGRAALVLGLAAKRSLLERRAGPHHRGRRAAEGQPLSLSSWSSAAASSGQPVAALAGVSWSSGSGTTPRSTPWAPATVR